jgi:integrase
MMRRIAEASPRLEARVAGVFYLLAVLTAAFAEGFVRGRLLYAAGLIPVAIVRVTHKPDRGWTPKTYKEREIPVPAKLLKALKAWKGKSDPTCNLMFPTAGCNPSWIFSTAVKPSQNELV